MSSLAKYCNLKMSFWFVFSSLTIHPNKLLVATGQTAGHDGREGKVRLANPSRKRTYTQILLNVIFFHSIASHPSVEFGQLGDGGRPGTGRVRTVHQLSVVFQSGKSTCGFSSARHIWADDVQFRNSIMSYLSLFFKRTFWFWQDGGSLLCAIDEGNDHNISVWDWQKNEKGHKITETKVSRIVNNNYCYYFIRYLVIVMMVRPCGFWTPTSDFFFILLLSFLWHKVLATSHRRK